jgi:hypothetical protein
MKIEVGKVPVEPAPKRQRTKMVGGKQTRAILTCPREDEEMSLIFDWVNLWKPRVPKLELLYHIPNETAWKLQNQGIIPGVSDLHLPVVSRGYIGLWIELKRLRGSKPTADQLAWGERMEEAGHCFQICYGGEAAIEVLKWYLSPPKTRIPFKDY